VPGGPKLAAQELVLVLVAAGVQVLVLVAAGEQVLVLEGEQVGAPVPFPSQTAFSCSYHERCSTC
jgi:hypothetical protein